MESMITFFGSLCSNGQNCIKCGNIQKVFTVHNIVEYVTFDVSRKFISKYSLFLSNWILFPLHLIQTLPTSKKKSDSFAFIALPEKTKAKFLPPLGLSYLQTLRQILGASIYDILPRKSDSLWTYHEPFYGHPHSCFQITIWTFQVSSKGKDYVL